MDADATAACLARSELIFLGVHRSTDRTIRDVNRFGKGIYAFLHVSFSPRCMSLRGRELRATLRPPARRNSPTRTGPDTLPDEAPTPPTDTPGRKGACGSAPRADTIRAPAGRAHAPPQPRRAAAGQIMARRKDPVPPVEPAPRPAAAMPPDELARLLNVPADVIRRHLAAGAPAGPDGTVNAIHYAAWLNRRLAAPPDNADAT